MKKCPHCAEEIQDEAKKCKHCGSDLTGKNKKNEKKKLGCGSCAIIAIIVVAILVAIAQMNLQSAREKAQSQSPALTQPSAPSNDLQVGQEGYLRLPGISDPTQVICLGSTKDEANKITAALLAKDFLGITELPGAFCVGNGTKALLIEKSFPLRKVRILKGVNDVDADKVGLSGWLPLEWVVAQ